MIFEEQKNGYLMCSYWNCTVAGDLRKWLMGCIMKRPDFKGFRRWILLTRDAHELYRKFGFTGIANPDRYMENVNPDVYLKTSSP